MSAGSANRRGYGAAGIVAVILVVIVVLVLTIWSRGPSSTGPTTTRLPSTSATTSAVTNRLAQRADQLCAETDVAVNDLSRLSVSDPTSLAKAPGVISGDLHRIRQGLSGVAAAGHASNYQHQLGTVVAEYNDAVADVQSALESASNANLGAAVNDVTTAVSDLRKGRNALSTLNLGACATPEAPPPTYPGVPQTT